MDYRELRKMIEDYAARISQLEKALQTISDWPYPYLTGNGIAEARICAKKALYPATCGKCATPTQQTCDYCTKEKI
ncbi:MAG: hypothetical protein WCT23_09565 [Candidatus Neomarinimicrobiota bacterium]